MATPLKCEGVKGRFTADPNSFVLEMADRGTVYIVDEVHCPLLCVLMESPIDCVRYAFVGNGSSEDPHRQDAFYV